MRTAALNRKVLVLGDEPSIQNFMTLAKELERESTGGGDGKAALAIINRKQFDAVILDLRCASRRPGGEVRGIREFRPSLMGKMLVINAEVSGPKTLDMVERYIATGVPRSLLWLICHGYNAPR